MTCRDSIFFHHVRTARRYSYMSNDLFRFVVGGEIYLQRKYSRRVPRPGIEPGTPGSVIERHNHEAKRSGPVRLVIYAPYILTYILIICTSLCRATTFLHPTMKHLYQIFSTIPRLFCDSVAIASPLSSDGSHPGTRHQM